VNYYEKISMMTYYAKCSHSVPLLLDINKVQSK